MEHDPVFVMRLANSDSAVCIVARELESKDHDVIVHATNLAPDRASWRKYTDKGDLHVDGKRIEVKGRDMYFWDKYWPHPDVIVCACASYDRAEMEKDTPYAYVCLDLTRTHVAIVHGFTRSLWEKKATYDPARDETYDSWRTKPKQVLFGPLSRLDELLLL